MKKRKKHKQVPLRDKLMMAFLIAISVFALTCLAVYVLSYHQDLKGIQHQTGK